MIMKADRPDGAVIRLDDDDNSPLLGESNPYYPDIMKAGNLVHDAVCLW